MVSAAALLWFEFHGQALEQKCPQPWQRAEAFRQCLESSAMTNGTDGKGRFGNVGILNTKQLLECKLPDASTLVDGSLGVSR